MGTAASRTLADHNCRQIVLFRVLFNARFFTRSYSSCFWHCGLTAAQYQLMNIAWVLAFVNANVPFGVSADRIGRRSQVIAAWICTVAVMACWPLHRETVGLCCSCSA